MWKKIIGWILFAYGISGIAYSLATAPLWGVITGLLLGGALIWGGWKLAHSKK